MVHFKTESLVHFHRNTHKDAETGKVEKTIDETIDFVLNFNDGCGDSIVTGGPTKENIVTYLKQNGCSINTEEEYEKLTSGFYIDLGEYAENKDFGLGDWGEKRYLVCSTSINAESLLNLELYITTNIEELFSGEFIIIK